MEIQVSLLSLSLLSLVLLGSTDECEREIPGGYVHLFREHAWFCDWPHISCCAWDFETPNGLVITLFVRVYWLYWYPDLCTDINTRYLNSGTEGCDRFDINVTEISKCSAVYQNTSCATEDLHQPLCAFFRNNKEIIMLKDHETVVAIPGWIIINGLNATYKYNESDILETTAISPSADHSPIIHLNSQNASVTDLGSTITVNKAFFYGILGTACTFPVILVAALIRYLVKKFDLRCVKVIRNSGFEGQTEEKIPDAIYTDITQVALPRNYVEEKTLISNSRVAYEAIHGDVMQKETVLMETPGYQTVMLDEPQTDGGYEIFMRSVHAQN